MVIAEPVRQVTILLLYWPVLPQHTHSVVGDLAIAPSCCLHLVCSCLYAGLDQVRRRRPFYLGGGLDMKHDWNALVMRMCHFETTIGALYSVYVSWNAKQLAYSHFCPNTVPEMRQILCPLWTRQRQYLGQHQSEIKSYAIMHFTNTMVKHYTDKGRHEFSSCKMQQKICPSQEIMSRALIQGMHSGRIGSQNAACY